MGEGQEPAGWTHSNLNAAEVSMTQQWVCGYHTGWASMFLSCLCRGTESRSIHGLDGQKTCSNLSANAPSFLSQTRAHLRLVSSFCQGVLTEWQSCALCYPPTHCICEFSSGGGGGYPRALYCYQESCGDRVIWVTGRSGERSVTCAHTPHVPGKELLMGKSLIKVKRNEASLSLSWSWKCK